MPRMAAATSQASVMATIKAMIRLTVELKPLMSCRAQLRPRGVRLGLYMKLDSMLTTKVGMAR